MFNVPFALFPDLLPRSPYHHSWCFLSLTPEVPLQCLNPTSSTSLAKEQPPGTQRAIALNLFQIMIWQWYLCQTLTGSKFLRRNPPPKQDYYPWFNGTLHPQCWNHCTSRFGQKLSHQSRSGLLRSLNHELHIAVDFITGLLLSHSNTTTIDDHSSKFVHFIPLYML